MIQHAYAKIDAEFAIERRRLDSGNQGRPADFSIQTIEKIPTRIVLTARGTLVTGRCRAPIIRWCV
jgi:hypothetical protein